MGGRITSAFLLFALAGCAARPSPAVESTSARLVPAEPAPATTPAATPTATAEPARPPPGMGRTAGWIFVAVGAEAATVALVTSVMILHDNSVRSSECNAQKACSVDGVDANNRIRSLVTWNAGAWAVAAVGLGAGAYLVLSNPRPADHAGGTQTAIGVAPNGSGVGLDLRSSF